MTEPTVVVRGLRKSFWDESRGEVRAVDGSPPRLVRTNSPKVRQCLFDPRLYSKEHR